MLAVRRGSTQAAALIEVTVRSADASMLDAALELYLNVGRADQARLLRRGLSRVPAALLTGRLPVVQTGDPGAEHHHLSRCLEADDHRRLAHRPGVRHASPMVGIGVVDTYGDVFEAHLARPRLAHLHVLVAEHPVAAFLMDDSGFGNDGGSFQASPPRDQMNSSEGRSGPG